MANAAVRSVVGDSLLIATPIMRFLCLFRVFVQCFVFFLVKQSS